MSITRDEILAHAQVWVDDRVPYNERGSYQGYREDCSGFVSMAWELSRSYTTYTLNQVASPITKDELLPGDVLNNATGGGNPDFAHVLIFVSWADSAHTRYNAYEENPYWLGAHYTTAIPYPFWPGYFHDERDYTPMRLNGLGSGVTPPTPTRKPSQLTVYVGMSDGSLDALNASDGKQRWRFNSGETSVIPEADVGGLVYVDVRQSEQSSDVIQSFEMDVLNASTGAVVWKSPLDQRYLGQDGRMVFTLAIPQVEARNPFIVGFDAHTGQKLWEFGIDETATFTLTQQSFDGGHLYLGLTDQLSNTEQLDAINETTGALLWSEQLSGYLDYGGSLVAADGVVYVDTCQSQSVNCSRYEVEAFDAWSGTQLWDYSGPELIGDSIEYAAGGQLNVTSSGTFYSTSNNVAVLDARTGLLLWSSPSICDYVNALAEDGVTYVTCAAHGQQGSVAAYNSRTGKTLWQRSLTHALVGVSGVAGGDVYIFTGDTESYSQVYALDAGTGATRWQTPVFVVVHEMNANGDICVLSQETSDSSNAGLVVFDARTGSQIWTLPNVMTWDYEDVLLIGD